MPGRNTLTVLTAAAGLAVVALAGSAGAASVPAGFIDTLVADGLTRPTAMAFDRNGRLFVAEQDGALRVIKDGKLMAAPFVTLTVDSTGERGLIGVAFDPMFASNHYVYAHYTVPGSPAHNRVSRFTASGDTAVPGSEHVVLDLDPLTSATNHNGGAIHFGKDGKVYVAVGDNNENAKAQSLTSLKGKILRINADGTIPNDNPFYGTTTGNNRAIWARGFRNPFTFAVQPGTGRIFVNDVGPHHYEEVDDVVAGANYGFPKCEGPFKSGTTEACTATYPSFKDPVFYYAHSGAPQPNGCAIVGGAFYNPPTAYFPSDYVGDYLFADFCSGWIERVDPAQGYAKSMFATGISNPVDLQVGRDGSVYYLARGSGSVRRISYVVQPTLTSFTPGSGVAGATVVTIDGTYLAGAVSVTFDGRPASFTVVSDTRLKATVPAGADTGNIAITTGGGAVSSASNFTVRLSVTGFTPASGAPSTPVTVNGVGFTGATRVRFNGKAAPFSVQSDGTISTTVPTGATSGPITVTTPAGAAPSAASFAVT